MEWNGDQDEVKRESSGLKDQEEEEGDEEEERGGEGEAIVKEWTDQYDRDMPSQVGSRQVRERWDGVG